MEANNALEKKVKKDPKWNRSETIEVRKQSPAVYYWHWMDKCSAGTRWTVPMACYWHWIDSADSV